VGHLLRRYSRYRALATEDIRITRRLSIEEIERLRRERHARIDAFFELLDLDRAAADPNPAVAAAVLVLRDIEFCACAYRLFSNPMFVHRATHLVHAQKWPLTSFPWLEHYSRATSEAVVTTPPRSETAAARIFGFGGRGSSQASRVATQERHLLIVMKLNVAFGVERQHELHTRTRGRSNTAIFTRVAAEMEVGLQTVSDLYDEHFEDYSEWLPSYVTPRRVLKKLLPALIVEPSQPLLP
jgi:hypothetical protein